MTDTAKTTLDLFANNTLMVNIAEIAENDRHVVYTLRLPIAARLDDSQLLALARDPRLGASLASWLKARADFWKFRK